MLCSLFRFMISHAADAGNQPGRVTARHLQTCSSCREFYNFCRQLDANLPAGAEVLNCDVSAALHEKILHKIDKTDTETFKPHIQFWPLAAAAVLVVFILLGGIYYFKSQQPAGPQINQDNPNLATIPNELPGLVTNNTITILTGTNDMLENQLKEEFQNISDDTESAVRFLFACVNVDMAGTAKTKNDN
jgi:hypothetical protein